MGGISDFFKSKEGTTITQTPMQTTEQTDMMRMLAEFAKTGKFGDYQAGEAYTGKLGEYGMTGLEGEGQSKMMDMLRSLPGMFGAGKEQLTSTMGTEPKLLTAGKESLAGKLEGGLPTGVEAGEGKMLSLLSGERPETLTAGKESLVSSLDKTPELLEAGKGTLLDLLSSDKFDPYAETGEYEGFKKGVLRESEEAGERLKRDMAITGDLFSTSLGKESGLLQERTSDILTNKMAELYDKYTVRKIAGAETASRIGLAEDEMNRVKAQTAANLGLAETDMDRVIAQTSANMGISRAEIERVLASTATQAGFQETEMGRALAETAANMGIAERGMESDATKMSQQFGMLERMLKDAEAKDKYAEWMRKTASQKETIDTAKTLFTTNIPYGVKSYTTASSASPFSQILNKALSTVGTAFGDDLLKKFMPIEKTGESGESGESGETGWLDYAASKGLQSYLP